jgi:hypothetical protein
VPEHGGPIREGEPVDAVPASYIGSVVGDRMTLQVVAGPDTLGPFVLRQGAASPLHKCLRVAGVSRRGAPWRAVDDPTSRDRTTAVDGDEAVRLAAVLHEGTPR